MRRFFSAISILVLVVVVGLFVVSINAVISLVNPPEEIVSENSLLHLELKGVIIDGDEFLELLRTNVESDHVKGVIVRMNSPGGVVGPSQEIYAELKRVREVLKKPVVVSAPSLMASGAYYAAVAADKIIVNPGTLMGSIGVIMEFANVQKLLEWAKLDMFQIKAGAFKDAGSGLRPMLPPERAYFQGLLDEVHQQFKTAVGEGRKLEGKVLDEYTDGRIFNGETAVKVGLADSIGTFEDARRMLGEMTGLGPKAKLFKPKKRPESVWEAFEQASGQWQGEKTLALDRLSLVGKPLSLLPGILR